MENLKQMLEKYLDEHLIRMVLSSPQKGLEESKVRIRPVLLKKRLKFQAEILRGTKMYHENYGKEEMTARIAEWMETSFRRLQAESTRGTLHVLVSKKGRITLKEKKEPSCVKAPVLEHNRKKRYLLEEGRPVGYLVDLGVMTAEGKIVRARYDKFRQINRFLEFIEDILPRLNKERESVILDFGCGKSYLTFAMYYYLKELKGYPVRIIGLDLKEDVIEKCNALARRYGYEKLTFYTGNIASYEGADQVDMVVTLHACDTATDYALEKAVRLGASVILSVPCCQHELNGQMESQLMKPVFQYGIIKERMAALYTDALRAQILEAMGYRVQILEFIDMEHTPKNLLIRAVKQGKKKENQKELLDIMEELHVEPTLYKLLMRN